jgi:hypothetical protein
MVCVVVLVLVVTDMMQKINCVAKSWGMNIISAVCIPRSTRSLRQLAYGRAMRQNSNWLDGRGGRSRVGDVVSEARVGECPPRV